MARLADPGPMTGRPPVHEAGAVDPSLGLPRLLLVTDLVTKFLEMGETMQISRNPQESRPPMSCSVASMKNVVPQQKSNS